ncbi:hypothetical protein [Amycolatopsis sp. H20-H5]|uniref:hypothetical protein n=1 Tax=Amycolatopsis sp. H20-H5 TaxID=3046309 RepID=UPI002DB764FE|nr:hypothetical protein [Amycolatopsis sp. H20-H5]MEC3975440.1 hypothetical protein [Amycolatopsis sp. H20-H5]
MRIRIALSVGALLLAGGAVMGTTMATAQPKPSAPPTVTQAPAPSAVPTSTRPPQVTNAPTESRGVVPAPTRDGSKPRVPRAVPAGPTGDLHLPAITDGQ